MILKLNSLNPRGIRNVMASLWVCIFMIGCGSAEEQKEADYQPTFESLSTHQTPQWFKDAKFGIFIHWGVYAVPGYNEWFLPMMSPMASYGKNLGGPPYTAAQGVLDDSTFSANVEEKANKFQINNYGEHFAYDDFIPMFKAEKFDPDNWATLIKEAGARYVVMTAKHGDEFALWPSKYNPRNSMEMGPHKDLLGAVSESIKKIGLKMGFYINTTYSFWDERFPNKEWVEYNNQCIKELIDKYQPSILWGDVLTSSVKNENGGPLGDDHFNSKEMLAYFYNNSENPDLVLANDRWGIDTAQKDENLSRSVMNSPYMGIKENSKYRGAFLGDFATPEKYNISYSDTSRKWETCDSMDPNSWGYSRVTLESEYMTSKQIIDYLVDIVSKGGNLLLNVGPRADGTIPELMQDRLRDIGQWMAINGEAIYDSHPWLALEERSLNKNQKEESIKKVNKQKNDNSDVRYTRNGDILYAIILDWRKERRFSLDLGNETLIREISLLGSSDTLSWSKVNGKIIVDLPSAPVSDFANTLKLQCVNL